jgi:DNA-binding IclR family transcriptional regulator
MLVLNSAIERALDVLELLDRSPRGWNISDIARKLRLPKSSAHVIVRTLESSGYVMRKASGREYYLSMKASALGNGFLQVLNLSDASLAHMKRLAEQTRLTTHVAVLAGQQAVYVQKVDGPGVTRFATWVGKRTNLHCTAVGKVLLAHARRDTIDRFLLKNPLARYTPNTITSSAILRAELERVREMGHAVDNQEEEINVRCLGVPVFNHLNNCVAALGITGMIKQIPDEPVTLLAGMESAAANISHDMLSQSRS